MINFISIKNLFRDIGEAFQCKGTIFTTKYFGNTRIICTSSDAIYFTDVIVNHNTKINECTMHPKKPLLYTGGYFRIDEDIVYKTLDGISSRTISASGGVNIESFYRDKVYFTEQMVGSSLLKPNSRILASSKTEPLILSLSQKGNRTSLDIYNLETNHADVIQELILKEEVLHNLYDCTAYFGQFETVKNHDIFINCDVLGFNKKLLFHSTHYHEGSSLNANCLSTDKLQIVDLNGDQYSDILCINSKQLIVNNRGDFSKTSTLTNLPSSFEPHFINQNVAFGDFDGNGISDLVILKGEQRIAFGDTLNNYHELSGAFLINGLNRWCYGDFKVVDLDNDEKDDLLCITGDKTSMTLSRTSHVVPQGISGLKKVEVELDEFVFTQYGVNKITDFEFPTFCNTTAIRSYNTKLGCAHVGRNAVESISFPISSSKSISNLSVYADIKSSYDLFANDIDVKNIENELINTESQITADKEILYDMFAPNSANTRVFDSKYYKEYYRDNLIKTKILDSSEHIFPHVISGGTCNKLYYNYTVINTNFSARAKIKFFDHSNKLISNREQLQKFLDLYVSGKIESVLLNFDSVTFIYNGNIALKTPYKKTVYRCSEDVLPKNDIRIKSNTPKKTDVLCALERSKIMTIDTQALITIKREDAIRMNGYIYLGYGVFPIDLSKIGRSIPFSKTDTLVNQLKEAARNAQDPDELIEDLNQNGDDIKTNTENELARARNDFIKSSGSVNNAQTIFLDNAQYEDTYSRIVFDNTGLSMVAYIRNTNNCPMRQIKLQFYQGNALTYEVADPYVAFDHIEKVRLEAFSKTKVVLLWSMFLQDKNQFIILADYLNTENSLLKIEAFDSQFKVINHAQNEINTLILCYRKSKSTISLVKTYADLSGFRLAKILNVDLEGNDNVQYDIRKNTDNSFYLVKHYNNQKGIFVQQYTFSLQKIGIEHNIQANPYNVKLDIYHDFMAIIWHEAYDGNQLYIQILQNDILTQRAKLVDLDTTVELKAVQINSISDSLEYNTVPDISISITSNDITYLLSLDNVCRLKTIQSFVFNHNMNNVFSVNNGLQNEIKVNSFIKNQKEIHAIIDQSNLDSSCASLNLLSSSIENMTKEESIVTTNIKDENTEVLSYFIQTIQDNIEYLLTRNSNEIQTFAHGKSFTVDYNQPDYRNSDVVNNDKSELALSHIEYHFTRAKNVLKIYTKNNQEVSAHKLNLGFLHNNYLLNAKLDQKEILEKSLNYIYSGISRAINSLNNNYHLADRTVKALICPTILNSDSMKSFLISLRDSLATKTVYNFITDTRLTKCKNDNNHYSTYREEKIINICPTYSQTNLENECKSTLQLIQSTRHEVTAIKKEIIAKMGPFAEIIIQKADDIYNNIPVNIFQICSALNPYKPNTQISHTLAQSIIAGIANNEPKLVIDTLTCQTMSLNSCSTAFDMTYNDACIVNYIYANFILSEFDHSVEYQTAFNKNCNAGCELSSPALKTLLNHANGNFGNKFTTNDLLNTTLLPNLTVVSTRNVKYNVTSYAAANFTNTTANNTNSTTSTSSRNTTLIETNTTVEANRTSIEEKSFFNASAYKNVYDLVSAYSINFDTKDLTFVTSIFQGSGFYEVRTQYFKTLEQKPYGLEMSLGRFDKVKQIKTAAYDQFNLLVAFSTQTKHSNNYHILVNILTSQNNKVLNIYPSSDGIFDIRTIPNTREFIVSYSEEANNLITKRYRITETQIVENSSTKTLAGNFLTQGLSYISAMFGNLFDIVWSGYIKQTIDSNGEVVHSNTNPQLNATTIIATSNEQLTSIAMQNLSHITVDSFRINQNKMETRHQFNISSDWKLHKMQYVSNDDVMLTLNNQNHTLQRIILNTLNPNDLLKESFYSFTNDFANASIVDKLNNGTQDSKIKSHTEFDKIILGTSKCNYLSSGINEVDVPAALLLNSNQSFKQYIEVLSQKLSEKQHVILKENYEMSQNYSLNVLFNNFNLTDNNLICIIDSGLEDNLYSQIEGVAGAIDSLESFNLVPNV